MAGPRETALAAVAAQLAKIQVTNGYANDVARVFRLDFKAEALLDTETPAAFVFPPLQGGRLRWMDADAYEYLWPLTIGAILKRTPTDSKDAQRETDMESLVNDVWRALLEFPNFGTETIRNSIVSDGPYFFDVDAGVGIYNCTLQLHMVFGRANL